MNRTISAADNCEAFLKQTGGEGSEIEHYLIQYLLVSLCSEMQEMLRERAIAHFNKSGDSRLGNFIKSTANSHLLRGIKVDAICGFLGHFGTDVKKVFRDGLDESDVQRYTNVVGQRDRVAHSSGGQITLRDFREVLPICESIVEKFEYALAYAEWE